MRENINSLIRLLLTKKFRLSVAVVIPLLLVLFVIGPLEVAIDRVQKTLPAGPGEAIQTITMLRVVMGVSAAAALAAGLTLSYALLAPIRKFMKTPGALTAGRELGAGDMDFDILGKDFSAMMRSLNRHVFILESLSGGVIAFDRDGRVSAVNPSAERMLGRRSAELAGKSLAVLCRRLTMSPDLERLVLNALRHGRTYASEEITILRSRETLVVGLTTSLLTDAAGVTTGVVANFMDLTAVRQMHEDLQQKLRMASLGTLAAGIAHEVRNPLAAVKGMAQLIQEGLAPNDARRKYGKVIEQETDRLNRVVEDLLNLAQGSPERTTVDVKALLSQARELAMPGLGAKRVAIADESGSAPMLIKAESSRLVQAFLNLFLNAFEAVPDSGRVRCRASWDDTRQRVVIEIGNSGGPLLPEVKSRMFEPFFTTKERGSGLGLAIAHQIIASHNGSISAESTEQETTFIVTLPVG